jgi:hypothetical protein
MGRRMADTLKTDDFRDAYRADMWRIDVAGMPISVRGQPAYEHLQQVNRSLAQMKLALHQIAQIAARPGGVGQIARDVLRVCK